MTELTGRHWQQDECPACGGCVSDYPPTEGCAHPFIALHWLAALSEDRICAGWHTDCQRTVLGWCEKPVPAVDPWTWPGWCTVRQDEADALHKALEECPGVWAWNDPTTDPCPSWTPKDAIA